MQGQRRSQMERHVHFVQEEAVQKIEYLEPHLASRVAMGEVVGVTILGKKLQELREGYHLSEEVDVRPDVVVVSVSATVESRRSNC